VRFGSINVDVQTEVDFELEIDKTRHPFQITEVMEPGRRRSDEYRDCDTPAVRHDDIERGTQFGCEWVRDAISVESEQTLRRCESAQRVGLCQLCWTEPTVPSASRYLRRSSDAFCVRVGPEWQHHVLSTAESQNSGVGGMDGYRGVIG